MSEKLYLAKEEGKPKEVSHEKHEVSPEKHQKAIKKLMPNKVK